MSIENKKNTPILPRGHGTKLKFHQSRCGNLCSCLELPLSSISEQMAWERLNHLANNFPPRKVFWLCQGPPPTQTSLKNKHTYTHTHTSCKLKLLKIASPNSTQTKKLTEAQGKQQNLKFKTHCISKYSLSVPKQNLQHCYYWTTLEVTIMFPTKINLSVNYI